MLKNLISSKKYNHEEDQYIQLIKDILNEGSMISGRNGNALTIFGSAMRFSLENNKIPLLTTKKVAWKTCLKELLWFIEGSTDNSKLQEQNVKIWNGNASEDFLRQRGLEYHENDLGPIYGHQWRHFNAPYKTCKDEYSNEGVDQLKNIIDLLKNPETRYSRRIVLSAWNPCQLEEMALPPCHILMQFNILNDNKLSCSLYQRSGDVGLGVPFNIASYSFLTHIIAHLCKLEPYEFIYYLGNCHIYDDHIQSLKEQTTREPISFPTIQISGNQTNIEDYKFTDITVDDYNHHSPITMVMRK